MFVKSYCRYQRCNLRRQRGIEYSCSVFWIDSFIGYVSHRLASTRFCDRIILIGAGGIAEMGTHEELMEAGKEYAHLYEVQSRYYTEGGMEDAAFDA